jgi:pimeloyl-ACP methyl ester carboxylesterase
MTSQLRLAVHSFPGERPVLLVHGFTSSAQIDWIEPGWPQALAAQGRGTVAVDLPGHGSCPAADRDAISVSAIIAGLVAAIDSTGQDEADVVGYSLGARLAWPLAATGRVGRLVLEGLGTTDPLAGMDIELLRAVAKGEAEAPDPDLAEFAAWISQPTSTGIRCCCSWKRWPPNRSMQAPTCPRSRRCSSREPRTILSTSWQRPFRTRNTCRCPVIIAAH